MCALALVTGNGDILSWEDYEANTKGGHLAGVMLARCAFMGAAIATRWVQWLIDSVPFTAVTRTVAVVAPS